MACSKKITLEKLEGADPNVIVICEFITTSQLLKNVFFREKKVLHNCNVYHAVSTLHISIKKIIKKKYFQEEKDEP